MEDINKFINAVHKMRELQKAYFKEKETKAKYDLLVQAKQAEREVDNMIIKLQTLGFEL